MQLRRRRGHLIALKPVQQGATDHGESGESPVVQIAGEHRTFHLDIAYAVVIEPPQPVHLGFRRLQTNRAVESELFQEELVARDGFTRHDFEVRAARVGGEDGITGCCREMPVEPVLTLPAAQEPVGLEVGHQPLRGDHHRASGQTHATAGSDPAPEDVVQRVQIPAFEEEHQPHELLHGDRCARHPHPVRGEQHPGGVPGDEAVLLGKRDDLRATVDQAPGLGELLDPPTRAGQDHRPHASERI